MTPKVSVCVTTYNHSNYISQALDGVLSQVTDFDFEILVGEDDSIDGTREIVKDYAGKYPETIRAFYNDRKNVIHINGRPTGRWNFINNLRHARGQYIALLEGDDFWADDLKLQKQVSILDQHPEYSLCFTNARIWDEDNSQFRASNFCEAHVSADQIRDVVGFADVAKQNWIATGSIVFRRSFLQEIPVWFYAVPMLDWGLCLYLLEQGPGRFLSECATVYRVHGASYWSSMSQKERIENSYRFARIVKDEFGKRNQGVLRELCWRMGADRFRDADGVKEKLQRWYFRARYVLQKMRNLVSAGNTIKAPD